MLPSQRTNYMAVEMHYLSQIFRSIISKIYVDEPWYIQQYPDVLDALHKGAIADVSEHYVLFGYYEHRKPYAIQVDENWYLTEYDDIRKGVQSRTFSSGQSHFDDVGYREGRFPYPNFQLRLRSNR